MTFAFRLGWDFGVLKERVSLSIDVMVSTKKRKEKKLLFFAKILLSAKLMQFMLRHEILALLFYMRNASMQHV
jgi:hypothetical protein